MRKLSILVLVLTVLFALINRVYATDILVDIYVDTTWTLGDSPYNLIYDIQVVSGVTLTIEPGVVVNGQHNILTIDGTLNAVGTDVSPIVFDDILILGDDSGTAIIIQFAEITEGRIYNLEGELTLRDSVLMNAYSSSQGVVSIANSNANTYIERNIFDNTMDIIISWNVTNTYIYNNVFYEQTYNGAIRALDDSNSIVKFNNFISTDRIALKLYDSANMIATENYWNTTDTAVIDSMIYDRNDDLNVDNYLVYEPILTVPHPNTSPFPWFDQILTIQTEPNDVNTVTPPVGQYIYSGLVDLIASQFINCPDVYSFDHWIGDVADANSPNTKVFMDSDKTVTAVFVDSRQCGDECHPYPPEDLSGDCAVNFLDIAVIAQSWLECTKPECD